MLPNSFRLSVLPAAVLLALAAPSIAQAQFALCGERTDIVDQLKIEVGRTKKDRVVTRLTGDHGKTVS